MRDDPPAVTLHDDELSASGHGVRMLLRALGVAVRRETVVMHPRRPGAREAWQRRFGADAGVPVLELGPEVFTDPAAMLVIVASRFDPAGRWLPVAARTAAAA